MFWVPLVSESWSKALLAANRCLTATVASTVCMWAGWACASACLEHYSEQYYRSLYWAATKHCWAPTDSPPLRLLVECAGEKDQFANNWVPIFFKKLKRNVLQVGPAHMHSLRQRMLGILLVSLSWWQVWLAANKFLTVTARSRVCRWARPIY